MYQHVRNLGTPLDRLFMPWYQPCVPRGYSKFYDGTPQTNAMTQAERAAAGLPDDPDRMVQYEVTDQYLNALESAFHQGQFDAGIDNVEDTSSRVFDFLAENCITTTEEAYRLGRAQKNMDPGGSVDPNYLDPSVNRPGFVAPTPERQDMSVVFGVSGPAGQPPQPSGGGSTPWSPQPAGGTAGPSPLASGPPIIFGGGGNTGVVPPGTPNSTIPRSSGVNWLLIAAAVAAAWFLLKDRS
jgi:hypothetical protein